MIDLRLGDCLELMRDIPDGSVDAVIADPPYGCMAVENSNRMRQLGYSAIQNDDKQIDLSELFRLSSKQIIFGGNFFNLPISRGWIVWDKQGGKHTDFGDCELIWTSEDFAPRIITHIWDGFLRDSDKGIKRVHPAQKPTGVLCRIIENFTHEGDTILDPFMGSGTTGVACVKLNRNFIGMEINPTYFEIAKRRIEEAQMQLALPMVIA